jgi:hypothetical protein
VLPCFAQHAVARADTPRCPCIPLLPIAAGQRAEGLLCAMPGETLLALMSGQYVFGMVFNALMSTRFT